MPIVSGCAGKMIVRRMEKTGGKRGGKCLFNPPALHAQTPVIYQLVDSSHRQSELPAEDQKLRRLEEYPAAERSPLLLIPPATQHRIHFGSSVC